MMTRLMSFLLLAGCTSLASQAVNPKSSDTPALQVSTSQLKNSRFHIVLDYHYNLDCPNVSAHRHREETKPTGWVETRCI